MCERIYKVSNLHACMFYTFCVLWLLTECACCRRYSENVVDQSHLTLLNLDIDCPNNLPESKSSDTRTTHHSCRISIQMDFVESHRFVIATTEKIIEFNLWTLTTAAHAACFRWNLLTICWIALGICLLIEKMISTIKFGTTTAHDHRAHIISNSSFVRSHSI